MGGRIGLTSYELLRIYPELHDVKAHQKQQDGKWVWETWKEHTDLCMLYFQRIWESKHLDMFVHRFVKMTDCRWTKNGIVLFRQMFQDVVVFHDVGKVNPVFQSEKMKRAVVNMVSLMDDEAVLGDAESGAVRQIGHFDITFLSSAER